MTLEMLRWARHLCWQYEQTEKVDAGKHTSGKQKDFKKFPQICKHKIIITSPKFSFIYIKVLTQNTM